MNKEELLRMLEQLPEQFDPEQLIHDLYLKAKLERAEEAIQRANLVSHDEVVRRSRRWFE